MLLCGVGRGFCTVEDMAKCYDCYGVLFGTSHLVPYIRRDHVGFPMLVVM